MLMSTVVVLLYTAVRSAWKDTDTEQDSRALIFALTRERLYPVARREANRA